MDRRTLIRALLAAAASPVAATHRTVTALAPATTAPTAADWRVLGQRLGDRLLAIKSPLEACARRGGAGAEELFPTLENPYYLGDEPALTQTLGWASAWTSRASSHAVAAENAADVAAAVDFARSHGVRLVVKGGGHSYFGNSNAAGSLLLWTRRLDGTALHQAFVPAGAASGTAPVHAVSVGAGAIWGRVYDAVAVKGHRYVQGGGCLTVGVAGFVQGGGFGSLSRAYGTGAASLLEAEVVTADGQVRIVNLWRDPDLFFALRGGGGGSFGVVTRLTLATHPLPSTIGAVLFSVTANSDAAWSALVARMMAFYAESLFNASWGEQLIFRPGRTLNVSMLFQGLDRDGAAAVWAPLLAWIRERAGDYAMAAEPVVLAVPADRFWDPAFLQTVPGVVLRDDRRGAPASNIFWATNQGEAAQVIHAYQSAWLPAALLQPDRRGALVEALVASAAVWSVSLHTNKGLAGGSPEALAASRATATNPEVLDAFALLICAAEGPPAWPGIPGHEPDLAAARRDAAGVTRAMAPIRSLVPGAGTYMSEADYFETDWKRAYWGPHYPRLAAAKRRYDPDNLFHGHHTVEPT